MKKALLLWIGMILLLIDVRITGLIPYPAYVPFDTPAPETVDMIIGHLIGDSVHIDLFSDVAGFVLIIVLTYRMVNENKKAFSAFAFSCLGLILYAGNMAMPFFLNGEARYSVGFFLYIICILAKCVAVIMTGFSCCQMAECLENHAWNNVVAIFVMLAAFTCFIRGLCHFYDLPKTTALYYGLEVFFTAVFSAMYYKRRHFIQTTAK